MSQEPSAKRYHIMNYNHGGKNYQFLIDASSVV
jgi:hypothetical protein